MTDEEVNCRKTIEEQIIAALKQYEGGETIADVCRKVGISQSHVLHWKKQYAGLACRSCGSCATRIVGSNASWRIFRWTGRS